MLSLLDINESALLVLHWDKKVSDPFSPQALQVMTDENHPLKATVFFNQMVLGKRNQSRRIARSKKAKT